MTVVTSPSPDEGAPVLEKLSGLDRFLSVWIGAAMLVGLALGRTFPGLHDALDRVKLDTVSLPTRAGPVVDDVSGPRGALLQARPGHRRSPHALIWNDLAAGSDPGDDINPAVAEILTERGLDVSKEFPEHFNDEAARSADVIITMGCGDACPVFPGQRYLDWDLTDPAAKPVEEVGPIVDDIDQRTRALLTELFGGSTRTAQRD